MATPANNVTPAKAGVQSQGIGFGVFAGMTKCVFPNMYSIEAELANG